MNYNTLECRRKESVTIQSKYETKRKKGRKIGETLNELNEMGNERKKEWEKSIQGKTVNGNATSKPTKRYRFHGLGEQKEGGERF